MPQFDMIQLGSLAKDAGLHVTKVNGEELRLKDRSGKVLARANEIDELVYYASGFISGMEAQKAKSYHPCQGGKA